MFWNQNCEWCIVFLDSCCLNMQEPLGSRITETTYDGVISWDKTPSLGKIFGILFSLINIWNRLSGITPWYSWSLNPFTSLGTYCPCNVPKGNVPSLYTLRIQIGLVHQIFNLLRSNPDRDGKTNTAAPGMRSFSLFFRWWYTHPALRACRTSLCSSLNCRNTVAHQAGGVFLSSLEHSFSSSCSFIAMPRLGTMNPISTIASKPYTKQNDEHPTLSL